MRTIGNLLWLVFGGFEAAFGYFTGSLALAVTIIGIPFAVQTFKLGLLCLWPFGAEIRRKDEPPGCVRIPLNLVWIIFGGHLSAGIFNSISDSGNRYPVNLIGGKILWI